MLQLSYVLRILAVVVFILGIFNVPWPGLAMACLGLALWCMSTLLPPPAA